MYRNLDKPLYDAEVTTVFHKGATLVFPRPSPQGTTLTDLSAESGSSAAPTPVYKFITDLPSDPKEDDIFKEMIKDWIVSSSEELDPASSQSSAKESHKASSQELANPQVSILGLDPGPTSPFPFLDAIPPFDPSSLENLSISIIPQLPFDPLTSFSLPEFDAAVGLTPSSNAQLLPQVSQGAMPQAPPIAQPLPQASQSAMPQAPPIAQPLPQVSQSVMPQAPPIASSHKVQEDVAPRRSNVLSSILIGSDVPLKCNTVRSTHMKDLKSTLGKRSERDEGSEPSLPLSGSETNKRRKLLPSYPFLPASSGSNTEEQILFPLDSFSCVPTATVPLLPSDASLGNFPILSPPFDPSLSLSPYLFNGPFYNFHPATFPSTDGLSNPPGYLDVRTSVIQPGGPSTLPIPAAGPPTTNASGQLTSKTLPDAPRVNIENRSVLRRTSSLMSTPTYDTNLPFLYEHRANPVRNHDDAMRVMFGTHSLTRGERETIERISGEQRQLIIERKVDCDAAGGTTRRR